MPLTGTAPAAGQQAGHQCHNLPYAAVHVAASVHTPTPQAVLQADWRQRFIQNVTVQRVLRVAVVFGVGAILSDGVLTPSISGASWN